MRKRTNPKEILHEEFMKPLNLSEEGILQKLNHFHERMLLYVYLNHPYKKNRQRNFCTFK